MLLQLTAAAAFVGASLSIGQLINSTLGAKSWTWTSAPVGFSALMIVLAPSAWLPGQVLLPLIVVALLTLASLVRLISDRALRPPAAGLVAAVPTLALLLFPFLANGRSGILGVGFNNDTASHLLLADTLLSPSSASSISLTWYPVGPHSLINALTMLGWPAEAALTGMTMAVVLITALAALAFLKGVSWILQAPIVMLTSLPFLAASYYGQGAFKELIIGSLMVGLAAVLEESSRRDDEHRFLPAAFILAGIVSTYSYIGLAWPFAAFGLIGLAWVLAHVLRGSRSALRTATVASVYPITIAGLLTVFLLLPQFPRIQAFYDWSRAFGIKQDDIGNLAGPLDRMESLGVWFNGDFRFPPADMTLTHAGLAVTGLLLLGGTAWALRRGLTTLPLFALACLAIALLAERNQSPYTVAKTLVIISPFVFLIIGRAVAGVLTGGNLLAARAIVLGVALMAGGMALWSSALALRSAQVGAHDHANDLADVRPLLHHQRTLYLGVNDFVAWELRGVPVVQPLYGQLQLTPRPAKHWAYGQGFDADTIMPTDLDTFEYVVVPAVRSDSALPSNFRRIATRGVYDVFQRTGPTLPRSVLPTEGQQGAALLRCETPAGRALSRRRGTAAVRGAQVIVPVGTIGARQRVTVPLSLGPGTWDLSLRYTSSRPLTISAPGMREVLPASFERVGSIWPAGTLHVGRPETVPVAVKPEYRSFAVDAATQIAPTELIAQRRMPERIVPLRKACGQFVDWYRLEPIAPAPQHANKGNQ